jgi:hypothetical protein
MVSDNPAGIHAGNKPIRHPIGNWAARLRKKPDSNNTGQGQLYRMSDVMIAMH